jgi:hypothetical protein
MKAWYFGDGVPIVTTKKIANEVCEKVIKLTKNYIFKADKHRATVPKHILDKNYAGNRLIGSCKYDRDTKEYIESRYLPDYELTKEYIYDHLLFDFRNKDSMIMTKLNKEIKSRMKLDLKKSLGEEKNTRNSSINVMTDILIH